MHIFKRENPTQVPWNKGKLTGQKPPLRLKHVWAIRTKLQLDGNRRDLALFNLAIDSKLRGCDVVSPYVASARSTSTKQRSFCEYSKNMRMDPQAVQLPSGSMKEKFLAREAIPGVITPFMATGEE